MIKISDWSPSITIEPNQICKCLGSIWVCKDTWPLHGASNFNSWKNGRSNTLVAIVRNENGNLVLHDNIALSLIYTLNPSYDPIVFPLPYVNIDSYEAVRTEQTVIIGSSTLNGSISTQPVSNPDEVVNVEDEFLDSNGQVVHYQDDGLFNKVNADPGIGVTEDGAVWIRVQYHSDSQFATSICDGFNGGAMYGYNNSKIIINILKWSGLLSNNGDMVILNTMHLTKNSPTSPNDWTLFWEMSHGSNKYYY